MAETDRKALADRLDEEGNEIARTTTTRLFDANPSWRERWGDVGRTRTEEDLAFTVSFLAAAIREDAPEIFEDYVAWLRSVLEPRGVGTDVIEATHEALEDELSARLDADALDVVSTVLAAGEPTLDGPLADDEPAGDEVATFSDALLEGDTDTAAAQVQARLDAGDTPSVVADDLITPAMQEVGRRWQIDEVTVADEHLATATARKVLSDLYRDRRFAESGAGRILLACVEGCHHSLGLEMVADTFEEEGWEVRSLGADVPVGDLVEHAGDWGPDVVGLSISMPQQIAVARRSIDGLRSEAQGPDPVILLGGRMANQFPHLYKALGADAWAPAARSAPEEIQP